MQEHNGVVERESLIAGAVIVVVIVLRLLFWAKFRQDWRGRRIAISTAQFLIVIATVVALGLFGQEHPLVIVAIR